MKRLEPRVLYFTNGPDVSDEDQRKARLISYNVGFRNAAQVSPKDTIEEADAVAGEAPDAYRAKYPHVENANQLSDAMRKVKAGTYRLPKFNDTTDEAEGSTITEEELARLAGEGGEGGGESEDDDDLTDEETTYLTGKSELFVAGFKSAKAGSALPADSGDEFSAGFNAYDGERTGTDASVPNPPTNAPAANPAEQAKNRRGRKAAATPATPPATTGPTWNT